ncbi:hypothetical protein I3760_01G206700 [Carya illinoinensis]|nr:hypothetical protein I3760_01G206700 [Carya illinoinensis]
MLEASKFWVITILPIVVEIDDRASDQLWRWPFPVVFHSCVYCVVSHVLVAVFFVFQCCRDAVGVDSVDCKLGALCGNTCYSLG